MIIGRRSISVQAITESWGNIEFEKELTSRIGKHAHQWRKLGWATTMGNVQSAPSWTWDTTSLRLLLALRVRGALLR